EQAVKSWEFPGDEFVTYKFVVQIFCPTPPVRYACCTDVGLMGNHTYLHQ
ncbi:unnamed protein product, partial [Pocillopora meandrina]